MRKDTGLDIVYRRRLRNHLQKLRPESDVSHISDVDCGAVILAQPTIASAAEIKSGMLKDGRVVITISGDIQIGDTDVFKAAIKTANDTGKLVNSIRLNSPGGNLLEGVKLAEVVKFAKMATNVGHNATCASACFLLFAAGEAKYANYTAQIGVHGASEKGAESSVSGTATISMARVAKDLGVPSSIIGRMVVTPPSDMVWLSPGDLQSMGTTMVGKPVQIAASAVETTTSTPTQLNPTPPRVSPQRKKPWNRHGTNLSVPRLIFQPIKTTASQSTPERVNPNIRCVSTRYHS